MTEPKYTDAQVQSIIDRVTHENSADGMDGDSWDRLLVRAALAERQAAMQGQGVDVDVRDAYRWRHARKILPVEYIEQSQREFESYGLSSSEEENIAADKAIDAAIAQEKQS